MKRLADIDACKGMAIALVVIGHVGARSVPADAVAYEWLRSAIYLFHMPFFMFLSGYVFYLTLKPVNNFASWLGYSKQKFQRLFPAYFLLAVLVLIGKLGAQQFVHVDNPAEGITDLLDILLFPMQSVSSFVWYIYVLFWMMTVTSFLLALLRVPLVILLVFSALLILLPKIYFLGLGQFTKLYFFFVLGCCAVNWQSCYEKIVSGYWPWAMAAFVGLIAYWTVKEGWDGLWLPISLLSIVALHGCLRSVAVVPKWLLILGAYSFVIYLFNTICIGVAKALLVLVFPMQEYWYSLLYVPVLTLVGIAVPILLKKYLFPFWPWLDRVTS